ncbi:hypothetical protein [Salisaeta longa]|uniref:hypothetical protein n=1 Tax=Salisaeta longa TaxID=503170 RepID=UPI0003B2FDBD|nr:hypothetical protein [Salisaeta longa]
MELFERLPFIAAFVGQLCLFGGIVGLFELFVQGPLAVLNSAFAHIPLLVLALLLELYAILFFLNRGQ